jgi:DNA-binding SARP family transcriptional activator/predicted ATPase
MAIRLLGEIRIQRDGETVALPASKRTRALLGFLVATGTSQSRQTLCDLLWEGPDDPRAALRWSLTKLRPLVNERDVERLRADRERIAFTPENASIDVRRLDALLPKDWPTAPIEEIEEAATLLQGEFLDGLDLPSCYRFHHWCLGERERWGALRRRALEALMTRLDGEPDRALPYARAMVAADPLSEAAHGKLVALLAALGRRKDSQDHYDYARTLLRRELNAPLVGDLRPPCPSARVTPLDPLTGVAAPVASAPAASVAVTKGLIGRVSEQAAIRDRLAALVAGASPPGLFLVGEPGIGKSRLLGFVAEEASRAGAEIVSARCFEAEAIRPYGCLADALKPMIEAVCDLAERRDLALFLPSTETAFDKEGSRTRLFAAVSNLLSAAAARIPLVLIIDDMQWIDEGSSSLLHYVLRTVAAPARFFFVGSARTDEIDENPWCRRLVNALTDSGAVKRLKLTPLGADEAAQFFAPDAEPGEVAAALQRSGGNPLFLVEIARAWADGAGSSGRDLDSLIEARIARLDDAARELVLYASATVRDFKPELLGAAMDVSGARFVETLDRLERSGLLKSSGEGRFEFAHDLIRQATYRGLSQPRRRLIHRQIARALEVAAQTDHALAGELAYHAAAAGDHSLAVTASIAAGGHCLRLFANTAANDIADRGLGHLQQLPPGVQRVRAHLALLEVKVFAGASPGLRTRPKLFDELRQAVEAAELLGLPEEDTALGWHLMAWSSQHANDAAGAREATLRAEELSQRSDRRARCQQLANSGRCLMEVEFDIPRARKFLREAERLAAELKLSVVELDWGRSLIARWDGDLAQAQNSMRRALTLAHLREDRWRELECLVWLAKMAIEDARFGDATNYCDEIDTVAERIGDGPAPVADALRAAARISNGADELELELESKFAALRALDDKAQLAYLLNTVAACRLERGRWASAHDAAEEALRAAQAVKRITEIVVARSLLACSAGAGCAAGDLLVIGEVTSPTEGSDCEISARARAYRDRMRTSVGLPTAVQTPPIHIPTK